MKTLTPTRFQYNLSLLNGGSTTVRVEQKVNGVYQYLATQQTQTSSGTYELSFVPTETDIRISVSGTSRYALHNLYLYLDRDQIDTLVTTYALSRRYRYGFNGQEKDDEVSGKGNSYTAEFWQYDSRLGRRWNIDPVDQISISNYAVFRNNPAIFIDPSGSTVEPTTEGAKSEMDLYGEKTTLNKKGKEIANKNYEPAFGDIYQKWKNDENIHVKFSTIGDEKYFGGSIAYEGENEAGQKVYNVMWNPNLTEKLGASGIFEESFHLMEALEGKEMAFDDKPNNGVKGMDIYDEVRAKQWVGSKINSVNSTYSLGGDYHAYTHYGYINKLNDKEVIKDVLMNGLKESLPPINKSVGSGSTLGGSRPADYKPSGFGSQYYSTFSPTEIKP